MEQRDRSKRSCKLCQYLFRRKRFSFIGLAPQIIHEAWLMQMNKGDYIELLEELFLVELDNLKNNNWPKEDVREKISEKGRKNTQKSILNLLREGFSFEELYTRIPQETQLLGISIKEYVNILRRIMRSEIHSVKETVWISKMRFGDKPEQLFRL